MARKNVFYIFRRDFRICDNTALIAAIQYARKTKSNFIAIFIFSAQQLYKNPYFSQKSFNFMIESLESLQLDLAARHIDLLYLYGAEKDIFRKLYEGVADIAAIFANKDLTKYATNRDAMIRRLFGAKYIIYEDYTIYPVGTINRNKKNYKKFTPYYNKFIAHLKHNLPTPKNISKINMVASRQADIKKIAGYKTTLNIVKNKFKYCRDQNVPCGGRHYAQKLLRARKVPTRMSAHLKYGNISVREFLCYILKKESIGSDLVRNLVWREFFYNIGYYNPDELYDKNLGGIFCDWRPAPAPNKLFLAQTGFPLIDAAIRELRAVGYIHNRLRLVIGSFLTKLMAIHWAEGEKFFANMLLDYDPIINNQNWRWVAGTGADARQAYIIYNPWRQSTLFDKSGEYIKKWVPELADVPASDIHKWYKYYAKHKTYIAPMFDYVAQKNKYLKLIGVARQTKIARKQL